MPVLQYGGTLQIEMRHAYTTALTQTLPASMYPFTSRMGIPLFGCRRRTRMLAVSCRQDGWTEYVMGSGAIAGTDWDQGIIIPNAGGADIVMLRGESSPDQYSAFHAFGAGYPASMTFDPIPVQVLPAPIPVNGSNQLQPFRLGRASLAAIRIMGLSAGTDKRLVSGVPPVTIAGNVDIPLDGLETLSMFGESSATIPYGSGYKTVVTSPTFIATGAYLLDWSDGSPGIFDTLILGADPNNTNTVFQNGSQVGTNSIKRLARWGFAHRLIGAAPIFSGMGTRLIAYSADMEYWQDIELIATDATSAAVLALNSVCLAMDDDGFWYAKKGTDGANSLDILTSYPPVPRLLPPNVPGAQLARFRHYDTPSGTELN